MSNEIDMNTLHGVISTSGKQGPAGPVGPAGPSGAPGAGVLPGGLTNQVLTKISNDDFDTEWRDIAVSAGVVSFNGRTGVVAAASNDYSLDMIADDSSHRTVTDAQKLEWSAKQDELVSGTNIKTINNTSLLGSGNIEINSAIWGSITGSIANQSDLVDLLDAKQDVISDLASIRAGASLGSTALQPGALDSYRTAAAQDVIDASKQSVISDLSTIRSNAAMATTAAQSSALASVAFSGSYSALSNKPVNFVGATASTSGSSGFVPAPSAADQDKYLKADGTWSVVSGSSIDYFTIVDGELNIVYEEA